jgi:N-acetylglutamate synthase-like GNAT family acetyltransferase
MRASPHCLRKLSGGAKVVSGNVGDHPLIAALLTQVALTERTEDFQSRNDAPSYSPADRLLVKRDGQLIGHVHLARSIGWFQGERCPLVKLNDFVMLPEYHRITVDGADYAAALLQVAESTAANEGALLAVQHTDQPEWFQQHGWSRCRAQGHTRANTRAILSHLNAQQSLRRQRLEKNRPAIEIRSWRHVELDCLRRIYQPSITRMWGALHRSEETWQWLVGRKAHDQILLAINRPARIAKPWSQERPMSLDLDSPEEVALNTKTYDPEQNPLGGTTGICKPQEAIGYAVLRDSCIVEMFTLPGFSSARVPLIARACRDAIDRDHHFVELHTPVVDPMHELLVTAGGSWLRSANAGGAWMFKLLAPDKWLERIYPVLKQRVLEEGLARPLEIALDVGMQTYQLVLSRRSIRLQPEPPSPNESSSGRVACDWLAFQDLLTSNLMVSAAIAQGRMKTAAPETSQALASLFPFQLFWQSPFEILRL